MYKATTIRGLIFVCQPMGLFNMLYFEFLQSSSWQSYFFVGECYVTIKNEKKKTFVKIFLKYGKAVEKVNKEVDNNQRNDILKIIKR